MTCVQEEYFEEEENLEEEECFEEENLEEEEIFFFDFSIPVLMEEKYFFESRFPAGNKKIGKKCCKANLDNLVLFKGAIEVFDNKNSILVPSKKVRSFRSQHHDENKRSGHLERIRLGSHKRDSNVLEGELSSVEWDESKYDDCWSYRTSDFESSCDDFCDYDDSDCCIA